VTPRSLAIAIAALVALVAGTAPARAASPAAPGEHARLEAFQRSHGEFAAALAAQRRGRLELAAERYAAALAADPAFVEAMVNLARVELARGDRAAADRWLDQALLLEPEYPQTHAVRGLAALEAGELSDAAEDLHTARRMAPDDVEIAVNLGAVLLRQGLVAEARDVLAQAVALDAASAAACFNLALAHDRAGATAQAAFHYRRFLELAPQADPVRERVAARLRELGTPAGEQPATGPDVGAAGDGFPKRGDER
jgi:tetratricopeptide (TPR) repeat protein